MSIENATYRAKPTAKKRDFSKDLSGILKNYFSGTAIRILSYYTMLGIVTAVMTLAITDLFPELTKMVGIGGLFLNLLILAVTVYQVLGNEVYLQAVWKAVAGLMIAVPTSLSLVYPGLGGGVGDLIGGVLSSSAMRVLGLQWGLFIAMSIMASAVAALAVLAQLPIVRGLAWVINAVRAMNYAQGFEPSITSRRHVPVTEAPADAPQAATGLVAALEAFGIVGAVEKGVLPGPVIARHLVKLPNGTRVNKIPAADLARDLHVASIAITNVSGGLIALDVPQKTRLAVSFDACLKSPEWKKALSSGMELPVCPGVGVDGKAYPFSLKEAVHLFTAGTTGAGKSVYVNAMLLSLMASGADFRLAIADGKSVRGDFAPYYGNSKHLLNVAGVEGIATKYDDMLTQLKWLVDEMDARYDGVELDLTPIIWVVDEVADIIAALELSGEKGAVKAFNAMLARISQRARAVSIIMILATQSPNSEIFGQAFRATVPSVIGLTAKTAAQSKVIMDEEGCELLLSKGDSYVKLLGGEKVRVHGALITKSMMETMVV
ncbi:DNA translocase FtsK [Thiothrix fructosivorans]|uniref:FtsK domain-containing protein n=1 Tax=Thiothrix fructosivorans TaxID=111770 RepID=A0A8B0SKR8_9GAMM|nr:DNA translocase FtsK [Thiothrix fructosivorans]MBO0611692.1 hypothetical protein [Thiothrix fructosivorans]QTX10648.1 hypothetical protein J1836_019120 [Thiothrix fructosivorans]